MLAGAYAKQTAGGKVEAKWNVAQGAAAISVSRPSAGSGGGNIIGGQDGWKW